MQPDKLSKLKSILDVLKEDTVSSTQLTSLLAGLVKVIQTAVTDTKAVAQDSQEKALDAQKAFENGLSDIKRQLASTEANLSTKVQSVLKEAVAALDEARQIRLKAPNDGRDGKDGRDGQLGPAGKDGSPDTAEQILAKLNSLPTDDENYQIDASRIKNLPKTSLFHVGGSGRMKVYYYDLTSQCNGSTKTFTVPLNFGILGVFSTQAPIIYRPQIDWTEGNRTLTLTSQVDAPQTGQTLWVQYIR